MTSNRPRFLDTLFPPGRSALARWAAVGVVAGVLAGILIKVGWDIVDWRFITHLHRVQREHLLVMLVTLVRPWVGA